MEYKDYYKVLNVSRDVSQDEIKRAYRKLARKYHPDVSKAADAEERFKEVNEAYEALKDPQKRQAYDQLGAGWQAGQEFTPPPGWESSFDFGGGGFTGADTSQFSDFFDSLFGRAGWGGRTAGFASRGSDEHARIPVTLEEAFQGATRTIQLQVRETDARGRAQLKTRALRVKIPKGVTHGQQIRLGGQGGAGLGGGSKGDLYLEVALQPHALYRVENKDIYLNLPVTPWEAALGTTIAVPTPGGRVDLKIPAGSQSGRKLRLKNRGLPGRHSGDLFVVLQLVTPKADTAEARAFYERMAREMPYDPRAHMRA